jgi:hypothetical protein
MGGVRRLAPRARPVLRRNERRFMREKVEVCAGFGHFNSA